MPVVKTQKPQKQEVSETGKCPYPLHDKPLPDYFRTHRFRGSVSVSMFLHERGEVSVREKFLDYLKEQLKDEFINRLDFSLMDTKNCENFFHFFKENFLSYAYSKYLQGNCLED